MRLHVNEPYRMIYISILKGRGVVVATTNRSENRVRYVESLQAIDRFVREKVATVAQQKQVIDLNILREDIIAL